MFFLFFLSSGLPVPAVPAGGGWETGRGAGPLLALAPRQVPGGHQSARGRQGQTQTKTQPPAGQKSQVGAKVI